MEKETYMPDIYIKFEKLEIEDCFFCLHDGCCDICSVLKEYVEKWKKENEDK